MRSYGLALTKRRNCSWDEKKTCKNKTHPKLLIDLSLFAINYYHFLCVIQRILNKQKHQAHRMVDQTIPNRKARAQVLAQAIIRIAIHPAVVGAGRHQVDHPTVCKTLNQPSQSSTF